MIISMYKQFSGIDEAALGPILGPYCCAMTSFKVNNDTELFDIFSDLKNIKIGDSKKLYTSGKSIKVLENTALSFYSCFFKSQPDTLSDLLSNILIRKSDLDELCSIPWFRKIQTLKLPISCERDLLQESIKSLSEFMIMKRIEIIGIKADVVSAERFNKLLSKGLNKSQCCQQILTPLIQCSTSEQSRLTVDRQGGRRYYGEWLIDIFSGAPLSINRETKDLSSYNIGDSKIQFQVKGDDKFLETALASIFSKYIRELMMICFNEYWSELFPGIKKTAGYPLDGKRFIEELNSRSAVYEKEKLIRQK